MHRKTTIEIIDEDLWAWAQYKAKLLKIKTSEFIFQLISESKNKE